MSSYSLWHHYISMASQPLANSDRGNNEDCWNHWINASSPIVLILTQSLCHSLFAIVTQQPLKSTRSTPPHPPCCHFSNSQSSPLFAFRLLLSAACSSFSHISEPLPGPQSSLNVPGLCHNTLSMSDCAKIQERLYPSLSFLFSCSDMTGAHPETVSAGPSCDTVCLAFKAPLLQTLPSFSTFEHLLLLVVCTVAYAEIRKAALNAFCFLKP